MLELTYISPNNTSINLTNNKLFLLTDADGLTAADVAISSTDLATHDGAIVNSARTQPRGIVLYLTIRQGANVEAVKREILAVIKPKQQGRLLWVQDGRSVEIEGIVESVSMPRFTNASVLQITMFCPRPFWNDTEYNQQFIEIVDALHRFAVAFPKDVGGIPFGVYNLDMTKEFENEGDVEIGAIITIIATGIVTNPLLERSDGTYFGVNETMQAGDSIVINTTKGRKSVTKNGVNIINKVKAGSTWLQLDTGVNVFTISEAGGTGNMYFSFEYKQQYV